MTNKKIPERMCVVCRTHKDKKELLRVVLNKEEGLLIDVTGKKNGRGAYICKRPECLRKARKQRRLETSLECSIPDEVYQKLEEELNVDNR